MSRLALKKGALPSTMMGLSGIGDLVLTCTSAKSRNYTTGLRIAKGESIEDIVGSVKSVAEGVKTSESVHFLSQRLGIDMPICEEVYQVLHKGKGFKEALASLESRPLWEEFTKDEFRQAIKSASGSKL